MCKARIFVAFSDEAPVVEVDDEGPNPTRVVRIANVEVHRCQMHRAIGT